MKSTLQNREDDLLNDEFMNSILDKNYVVKIGKWFIKLNPLTEKIYAVSDENPDAYELVNRQDENNSNVYTFTFNDDVLTYLADEELLNDRKLWCHETGVAGQEAHTNLQPINGHSMRGWLQYNRYGIYFNMRAITTSDVTNFVGQYRFYIQGENVWYHVKRGTTVGPYSFPWYRYPTPYQNQVYNSYQGSKKLNGLHFRMRVRCEIVNGSSYTTVFTSWCEIERNSPF